MKMTQKFIFGLLLATVMTFVLLPVTAQAEGSVTEQYNLAPGGIYYFDLSGENLPGTVNDQLPDTSLRWVPFTYVGTINAYSLDAASNNDPLASAKAVASDRSLFVAEYNVTTKVKWGDLNGQNLIFGRDYQSGGVSYHLRSLSAGSNFNSGFDPVTPVNNEWDRILAKNAHYIKNFLGVNGFSLGQDTVYHDPNPTYTVNRPLRGFYTAGFWLRIAEDSDMWQLWANCSFRPALEITSDFSTNLKTITFDMGSDGCLGSQSGERNPGSLTSATVVYTGSITLPDFTADNRFTHLSSGWGKIRWSDGTNFYEPGKEYDLPTGTVLRPGYEPVAEQYNLNPGGIYYFDLSGENIPGEVNYHEGGTIPAYGFWPDTTLKWVPFLYAGTINAYSLDASSSGDASASANAVASDRSLFVSTCDGIGNVSWDTLNGKGLIFGKGYESGGVSYSLRSMSMGSSLNGAYPFKWGAQRGLPGNNEWDQLLDKDAIYQFRGWNLANWIGYRNYMGQDTTAKDSSMRAARRPIFYREFHRDWVYFSTDYVFASHFFRPVLEIKSPTGTELKTITFDLGTGGTLGVNSPSPNPGFNTGPLTSATVVYTGPLTLPEITTANGFNYTGSGTGTLGWYDGTTFYAPGTPVTIATGTTLTAGYGVDVPAVDAGNSSVSNETTPVSPAANSAFTFMVSVRNAAGEPVSGLNQAAFAITKNGAGSLTVDSVIEDGTTGNYTVTARHDTAETITIKAAVAGVTITDTLDNVVVQAAADQSDFSVQLETAGDKTAGQSFNLSITGAKGADGSALSGSITVTVTSNKDGEVHNAAITFTAGSASVPIILTAAGSHTLTVTVTGVTNPETVAAAVVPAGVNAGKSTVSAGTTPASPVINSAFTFTVAVRDTYDNPVSGLAAGDFDITENGAGSLTVDSVAEDGTTGNYTVTASHDAAETVTITMEVSSVEVGSTAGVVIRDAADQSDFSVQLETAGDKTAGQPFNLSITNAKATSCSALSVSINVTVISSVYGEVHNTPITFTAGTATVPVTLTTAGSHILTVTVTGVTNPETVNVTVVAAVTTGSISGTVLYDDGGGGSSPLEGATVTVTAGGTDYTATTAADGAYTISNVSAGSGYAVTASKTGYHSEIVNNVTVTAGSTATVDFILTPASGDVAISIATIPGVTFPVRGATPVTAITETAQYTGTVTWSPNHAAFAGGTVYTATITLTPKAGYTLTGVGANFFTVAGATSVSHAAGSGVVTAVFPATKYIVTFDKNGGTTDAVSAAIQVNPGASIGSLPTAPSRSGYTFNGWNTARDGSGTAFTASTVVSGDLTAYAQWTYNGGGSGGGSSGNGTNVTIQPDKRPDQPVMAGFSVTPTVNSSGHATVSISQQSVEDAIAKALADAKAQGKTANGIGISLNIDLPDKAKSLGIVLPQAALQSLISASVRQLEINGVIVSLDLNLEALKEIQRQSTGEVTITIKPAQNLSAAARKLIGARPVYDVSVSYVKDGKTVNITSLGKGSATLSLPYKPGKNEAVGRLFGVYVDGKGNATRISGSAYDANNGNVILDISHFSIYGVGYTAPTEKYTDITNHWAKESIDYLVGRGLFSGTTDTNFSPNTAMDRGMLVTVLGRLAGADVSAYKTSSFTDVAAGKYYLPYVEWAYKKGIVSGIGNGKFAPERAVTREEFALILQNYVKVTGYTLPVTREAITFADNSSIGCSYAAAVRAMQQASIIMGSLNNKFNPQAGATRAEVATMLHRYVKLTIDPATAQGWAKNDGGRYMYCKDGKPLTGWQTIDGVKYYFNSTGVLQTGWVKDGSNWRYYPSNKALTGWWDIGSTTYKKQYYFGKDGVMVSGKWLQINDKWYYFYTDGSLAKSTTIDGYEVDENGVRKSK